MAIDVKQLGGFGAVDGQGLVFDSALGNWLPKLKGNMTATVPPASTDDSTAGYEIGSQWVDATNLKSYICLDATAAAAVWSEQTAGDLAYGELYSTSPVEVITVVTAGVYVKWTDSTVGDVAGAPLVTGSASTDDITIGAEGGGLYNVHWDLSVNGPNNAVIDAAIHVNNVLQADNQGRIKMTSPNSDHMPSGSSLIQLVDGDVVDLRVTSSGDGDVLNVSFVNLHIVRLGGSSSGGGSGGSSDPVKWLDADQLLNPTNADWAVNALAPLAADSNNAGLFVRLFDDTVEEGVGFFCVVPIGATSIKIIIINRAETGPAGAVAAVPKIYNRGIPNNAVVEAWSAGTDFTAVDLPITDEFFQYDEQTFTLASLGITAGDLTQFELTRNPGAGGDTLVGDWAPARVGVEFI